MQSDYSYPPVGGFLLVEHWIHIESQMFNTVQSFSWAIKSPIFLLDTEVPTQAYL